jgi:hypothetical protein
MQVLLKEHFSRELTKINVPYLVSEHRFPRVDDQVVAVVAPESLLQLSFLRLLDAAKLEI